MQHPTRLACLLIALGVVVPLTATVAPQAEIPPGRELDRDDRVLERHTPNPAAPAGAPRDTRSAIPLTTNHRTDLELSAAVERELARDPLVSLENVEVGANDGTVTLVGTVTNLLAKERAIHLAETVRGVYRVLSKVMVVPRIYVNPQSLEDAITTALLENPATESYKVTVRAAPRGEVTLTGRARSWAEKELVSRVAKGVRGVTSVHNAIDVIHDPARTDGALAAEVRELLLWDAYIADGVDVQVRDGVVLLSGTVASPAEKRRAIAIASLSNPRSVEADALEIDESAAQAAPRTTLAAATEQARESALNIVLNTDPELAANKLQANVENGVATLRGRVDSLAEKRSAARAARTIEGIDRVNNELTVAKASLSDQQIVTRAVRALGQSPITEANNITVSANDGAIELTGKVDTWYQRGLADQMVARIPGVQRIENDLKVARSEDRFVADPYVDTWSLLEYDWYTPSTPTIRKQDSAIAEDIRDEFLWSPFVDGSDIRVSVDDGIATLTGTVASTRERRAAAENALEGGASSVVNRLRLE